MMEAVAQAILWWGYAVAAWLVLVSIVWVLRRPR